jgi:hypothetical protein
MRRSASGGADASSSASSYTPSISASALSYTPEHSPMRSASAASTLRLSRYISRALAEPTIRGSVQVPTEV